MIADLIRREASQREDHKLAKNSEGVAKVVVEKMKNVMEFKSVKCD